MRRMQGFTLLEMSVVLLIIAMVMGGGAVMFSASVSKRQLQETMVKLEAIQKALLDYRRAFDTLPCSADISLALSNSSFGVADSSCTGNYSTGSFPGYERMGMVPVRTLGLPDDYAFDGWGSRIYYAVADVVTLKGSTTYRFSNFPITNVPTLFTIVDSTGATKTDQAIYVLMSAGRNRHGAFGRNITSLSCNTGAFSNANESANCPCAANASCSAYDSTFVQAPIQQTTTALTDYYNFDDIVLYAVRADLRLVTE